MMECKAGLLPKVAELIQQDYDLEWFSNQEIRNLDEEEIKWVKDGVSPFKAEVAHYIKEQSKINEMYEEEISLLQEISEKSIAGVITTNYDTFLKIILKVTENMLDRINLFFQQFRESLKSTKYMDR